jgi:hypothetical protein
VRLRTSPGGRRLLNCFYYFLALVSCLNGRGQEVISIPGFDATRWLSGHSMRIQGCSMTRFSTSSYQTTRKDLPTPLMTRTTHTPTGIGPRCALNYDLLALLWGQGLSKTTFGRSSTICAPSDGGEGARDHATYISKHDWAVSSCPSRLGLHSEGKGPKGSGRGTGVRCCRPS